MRKANMDNTNHNTQSSAENETVSEFARQFEPTDKRKAFIAPDVSAPITVGSLTLANSTTEVGPGGNDEGGGAGLDLFLD